MTGGLLLQAVDAEVQSLAVAARGLAYAGWLATVGLLLYFAAIDKHPPLAERRGARATVAASAALTVAAGLVEAFATAPDASPLDAVSRWARVVAAGALALVTLGGSANATRWGAGFGTVALVLWTAGSRAAAAGDVVAVASDWLHLVAAAAWVGVLGGLLVSRTADGSVETVASDAVRRIRDASMVALLSVFALALTGLIQAFAFLDAWDQLLGTTYGRTLVVKLALVGVALALGGLNRLVFLPKIQRREPLSLRALRNAVTIELVVLMGVVAATALLVHLPI